VIRSITNGYGTKTHIQYDPLTNGAVYRRAQNSRSLVNTGRGTAVQDLGGAIYVVSKVQSDAPTADDPNATSKLYYQYADARIQGGGRGNLGFAEIRTIDPNFSDQHVVSISKYSQAYPFTGMPRETRKVGVAGAYAAPACVEESLEAGEDCFKSLGQSSPYFFEPLGKLLSYARNLYAANETYLGVVHPYMAASFEVTGNPEADSVGIQTLTTAINYFEFGGYGNAPSTDSYVAKGRSYANLTALRDAAGSVYNEASGVRGAPCATGCVKHTRTEGLTYADDTVNWRIGRLTASTVLHTRYSAAGAALPTKTRSTAFTYYMDGARTGLLKTQTLQPGRGGSQEMRSINFYDDYGNSIGSMQCSSDVAANDCDDPGDFGKVLQRTKGANDAPLYRVHRYSRSTMSTTGIDTIDGRYAVGGFAPFFNASASSANQVSELSTGQVLARDRDALGNVKYTTDAHGVWASATFGPMGRGQTSADQSGGKSASEFHWCAPAPNNSGPVAACPGGAIFRQTSYTLGGARSITFFDKLGRAYFAVTEGFNADVLNSASNSHWSGACTGYDTRGRVVRVTNPFYVNINGAASPPTLLDNASCVAGAHAETRTTYDYLDRVTEILMPEHTTSEPASTHNVFAGLLTTTRVSVYRDGDGNGSEEAVELIKEEWTGASGLKVTVKDQDMLITNYAYDSVDQLTALSRQASAGSNVITSAMVYDDLGRKTEQSDPDAGTVRYAYNAAGEMICAEDARGMATVTDYDALGRAWRVSSGRPAGSCALPATVAQTLSATAVPTVDTGASRSIDLHFSTPSNVVSSAR